MKNGSKKGNFAELLRKTFKSNTALLVLAIMVVIAVGGIATDNFVTVFSISRLVRQATIMGFLAIGMTFVIAGGNGGIDLSVGATVALSGMIAISLQSNLMTTTDMTKDYYGIESPVIVIYIVCILAGVIVGFINGIAIVYSRLSPFVVTLCTCSIIRGCVMVYTNGNQFSGVRDDFKYLGNTFILGNAVPLVSLILLLVAVVAYILMQKSSYGKKLFFVGTNIRAAEISGINVKRIQISTYVIAGALSALGGILLTSFSMSANPQAGDGYELDAISAVLIGGTSMAGGQGSVSGTVSGLLFIYFLKNLLKQFDINTYIQQMIVALMIMAVVLMQERGQIKFIRGTK